MRDEVGTTGWLDGEMMKTTKREDDDEKGRWVSRRDERYTGVGLGGDKGGWIDKELQRGLEAERREAVGSKCLKGHSRNF